MASMQKATNTGMKSTGYVYVMTHSIFSDVVHLGCTNDIPEIYAAKMSEKIPGNYHVTFALQCVNPTAISNKVKEFLKTQLYVNEFYQVLPEVAERLLKREALRIPILEISF